MGHIPEGISFSLEAVPKQGRPEPRVSQISTRLFWLSSCTGHQDKNLLGYRQDGDPPPHQAQWGWVKCDRWTADVVWQEVLQGTKKLHPPTVPGSAGGQRPTFCFVCDQSLVGYHSSLGHMWVGEWVGCSQKIRIC